MAVPSPLLLNPPEVARVKCWSVKCTKHLKLRESFTCLSSTNPASSMPACWSESSRKIPSVSLYKLLRISCWEIATVSFAQLQMENWHILNLAFLWTLKFILEGTDPLLQCSHINWLLLTGWFAANSDVVDYRSLPKALFPTSQMFLIQGFEANPSYTLWIWAFLPTWEAMQMGYISCFGEKNKIREDLQFSSSCLRRSILQSFVTAATRGSDSHWHYPECGPHSKAFKVKAMDRRETRWKNDLFMLLPSCVRMGTHGAYTVWLAPGSWPCVIQVTRCSNHSATDAVSPSPRKYLISCTMQKQLPKENSSAKQPSTSC